MKLNIPKDWFEEKIKLEGDSEIGAGNPNFITDYMSKGDVFKRTCKITGITKTYTYTGTFREVKSVNYFFFEDNNGETSFWLPSEVNSEFIKL